MGLRFVHSFSTKPLNMNFHNIDSLLRICGNIWYYTLSVLYLKRLGLKVVLHTDDLGKYLFKCVPYNDVYDTCNAITNIHPRFWASAKFFALNAESLDAVHIDGDVFIKTKELLDTISNVKEDVLILNEEPGEFYETEDALFKLDDFMDNQGQCILKLRGAYNTGILKFNNQELKDAFIKGYFLLAEHYSESYDKFLDSANRITPDLIIEQQRLKLMCKDYSAFKLLRGNPQVSAINLGYQHILSHGKFNEINKVVERVRLLDENIYQQTVKHCLEIIANLTNDYHNIQ